MSKHHRSIKAINMTKTGTKSLTGMVDAHPWKARGVCRETDPELFFPNLGAPSREAKRICRECPVIAECLEHAIVTHELYGVWGGTSERERRDMTRARNTVTDIKRRRTKGVNLNTRIADELRIMAATGVTVTDAMTHIGWDNPAAMQRTMFRYGLNDLWAQLRRNSHTRGVRVDGGVPKRLGDLKAGHKQYEKAS